MSIIYNSANHREFGGIPLYTRTDGLVWMTGTRKTSDGTEVIGLYLCRQTAKPDTYEWLSFRCSGYEFDSVADALAAAHELDNASKVPAKAKQSSL